MTQMTNRRCLALHIEVAENQVQAFAQFLKRAGWSHYRQLAIDDEEAYDMQTTAERLRHAIASSGFAPR